MAGVAEGFFTHRQFQVRFDHHFHQFIEADLELPAKLFLGFGGIAQQQVHLSGAEVARVVFDEIAIVQADLAKRFFAEFADGMGFAR